MTNRPHRPAGTERVDGHLLDLGALEIGAHAAGLVPAGQQQGVVLAAPGRPPVQRRPEGLIGAQRRIGLAGRSVGPQDSADHGRVAQAGDGAPGVKAAAGHHQVVGLAGLP